MTYDLVSSAQFALIGFDFLTSRAFFGFQHITTQFTTGGI